MKTRGFVFLTSMPLHYSLVAYLSTYLFMLLITSISSFLSAGIQKLGPTYEHSSMISGGA